MIIITLQNRISFVVTKVVCFAVEAAVSRHRPKRRMPACLGACERCTYSEA